MLIAEAFSMCKCNLSTRYNRLNTKAERNKSIRHCSLYSISCLTYIMNSWFLVVVKPIFFAEESSSKQTCLL